MQFTLSTIAAAAVFFAATDAAPFGGQYAQGNGVGDAFPSGPFPSGAFPSGFGGDRGYGGGSGDRPQGTGVGGSGLPTPSGPIPTEAPALPSGGAALSSISFELPSTIEAGVNIQDDDEDSRPATSATAPSYAAPTGGYSNSTTGGSSGSSATSTFPEAAGESILSEPMVITGSFDGGLVRFGRGVSCSSGEGGDSDAVFQIEDGGSLSNVIIGADQIEGVHCMGSCTITNVWWEAVCEDALTIKQESGTSTVSGGGAKGASDKVIQHNGGGSVSISGFYVSDFGKLYRSCGNCKTQYERHVTLDGITADGGTSTFIGINTNYGDTATITNSCITNTDSICQEFDGNDSGDEPTKTGEGPSDSCKYTEADINAC